MAAIAAIHTKGLAHRPTYTRKDNQLCASLSVSLLYHPSQHVESRHPADAGSARVAARDVCPGMQRHKPVSCLGSLLLRVWVLWQGQLLSGRVRAAVLPPADVVSGESYLYVARDRLYRPQPGPDEWERVQRQRDRVRLVNTGSLVPDRDGARLILKQDNAGTKISSTRYIHYGTVDFTLESSKWAGVVTAAITMSDVKDEIDWEWPGTNVSTVQTNYWFLGVANYSATEGASSSISSDASANFHTYTFEWQQDYINWIIDGTVVRTVKKADTLSPDGSQYKFPSTPSRVQISIWPAGTSANAPGTISWAGGLIDWSNGDYVSNGYFWNTLKSVKITCGQGEQGGDGVTGWAYQGNDTSRVPMVSMTNASTLISRSSGPVGVSLLLVGVLAGLAGSVAIAGVTLF
nr:hypothetical protein L204_00479 [Cryptococcus depauperatus CBS 7855]